MPNWVLYTKHVLGYIDAYLGHHKPNPIYNIINI